MQSNNMTAKLKDIYLANARQAESNASKSTNPRAKDAWRKIAESYRFLAANNK